MSGVVSVYHGTVVLAAAATSTFDFDGTYGAGVAVLPGTRRISPPACGVVRAIVLRTLTVAVGAGLTWRASLWSTSIMDGAADRAHFGAQAVHFIHRTASAVIPADAGLAADPLPDLREDGEWVYDLQERTVPGALVRVLRARLDFSGNVTGTFGFSVYVESRVPGFPSDPLQQHGGVFPPATIWPPGT